jgi:hypothetical protein
MSEKLAVTRANLRRLRAIYGWLTAAGAAATGIVALLLAREVPFSGPIIAASVVAVGVLVMGAGLLIVRGRVESAPAIRLLRDHPERIVRVYPKLTESVAHGATLASYAWVVVEDDRGCAHDLYVGGDDVESVIREVRACAPNAAYDPTLRIDRLELRVR